MEPTNHVKYLGLYLPFMECHTNHLSKKLSRYGILSKLRYFVPQEYLYPYIMQCITRICYVVAQSDH